jgi:hypothetical protein
MNCRIHARALLAGPILALVLSPAVAADLPGASSLGTRKTDTLLRPPRHGLLDLPTETVVVKDFSRLRRDLLDTLKVNLPDGEVEIRQFRGAEVVLDVKYLSNRWIEDVTAAEQQLREHTDQLVRSAAPGMKLASHSNLSVSMAPDVKSPHGEFVGRLKADLETPGRTASVAGQAPSSDRSELFTKGFRAYLARRTGKPVPSLASEKSRTLSGRSLTSRSPGARPSLRPETVANVERFAPEEAREESGAARDYLREKSSVETTVRALYRQIHQDLELSRQEDELRARLAETLKAEPAPTSSLGSGRPLSAPRALPRSPQLAARIPGPPAGRGTDAGLSQALEGLFDTSLSDEAARPGMARNR